MESENDSRAGDFSNGDDQRDPNYELNKECDSPSSSPTESRAAKRTKTKKKNQNEKPKPKQKSYKKKPMGDWPSEEIHTLIKEVQGRRVLYDSSMPENKLPKTDLWQEVADVIGTSVDDCKGKWGYLRTTFNYNMNKYRQKKSGQGTDESNTITWQYFKAMLFLEACKVSHSSQSTSSMELVIISGTKKIKSVDSKRHENELVLYWNNTKTIQSLSNLAILDFIFLVVHFSSDFQN